MSGLPVAKPDVEFWWRKIVPRDSIQTKIISHIANFGPSSGYDLSKAIYGMAPRGYANILRNLKEMEAENILKASPQAKTGDRKRIAHWLSEYVGIPSAWAHIGESLNFAKLLKTHEPVMKQSKGLDAYKVMWDVLGASFCVRASRKSFISIIQGLDDKSQLFYLLVSYILDESIRFEKIAAMSRRNDLFEEVIEEARDELGSILLEIRKSSSPKRSTRS